ncbi:hypothetical protein M6B38_231965 [Iris pallida]|uniref:Uncharacterized protein n=1 Tax=Iris pallida TaxID=29817 RepID=A0AAX6DR74_IRIPA|nr:hypothetical protein M6B38_231965 [Iris pallida]
MVRLSSCRLPSANPRRVDHGGARLRRPPSLSTSDDLQQQRRSTGSIIHRRHHDLHGGGTSFRHVATAMAEVLSASNGRQSFSGKLHSDGDGEASLLWQRRW